MVFTLAYALVLAVLLLLVDMGAMHDIALLINQTFLLDKVIHFFAFGLLALLANAALLKRSRSQALPAIVTGSLFVIAVATVEEFSNALTAFRTCSLGDLAANYLGIVCLGVLPLVVWHRQQTRWNASI